MPVIWIPDGEPFEVEWYTSDGKATGIERMSTGFMRHDVAPKRTGFEPPRTLTLHSDWDGRAEDARKARNEYERQVRNS